jgi:hypothetical protein
VVVAVENFQEPLTTVYQEVLEVVLENVMEQVEQEFVVKEIQVDLVFLVVEELEVEVVQLKQE